jgi:transcriptional regulator with XRE-family HTH domain
MDKARRTYFSRTMSQTSVVVIEDVGERAKSRRKDLGMSQEDVAYKVKVEQTIISKVERGAKRPSPDLARRLATALGLPEDSFLKTTPI